MANHGAHKPCHIFKFVSDTSKSGRVLSSVKIGSVFMSRLTINPGVATGNLFHKKTRVMFYVEKGSVLASFIHVRSKEKKQIHMRPDIHVIQIPRFVAHATKNVGRTKAVLVFFSDHALRSGDDYPYEVLD